MGALHFKFPVISVITQMKYLLVEPEGSTVHRPLTFLAPLFFLLLLKFSKCSGKWQINDLFLEISFQQEKI